MEQAAGVRPRSEANDEEEGEEANDENRAGLEEPLESRDRAKARAAV